jgi:UDP-N-acetylmuramoyl-tripeptide--D-alanyl-D-alanine ligase
VILNIGPAHLETLHSIEAVTRAKFEILSRPRATDWAVLNVDDPNIARAAEDHRLQTLSFGLSAKADVRAVGITTDGCGHARFQLDGVEVPVPLPGHHQIQNCLAAIAVGRLLDLSTPEILTGLAEFEPAQHRMAVNTFNGVTIINDAYNANPTSSRAAISTLRNMDITGRRMIVFGDMLELGSAADDYHREIGRCLAEADVDYAILLGDFAASVREAALAAGLPPERVAIVQSGSEAVAVLAPVLRPGDAVLLKASRALGLERAALELESTIGRRN